MNEWTTLAISLDMMWLVTGGRMACVQMKLKQIGGTMGRWGRIGKDH